MIGAEYFGEHFAGIIALESRGGAFRPPREYWPKNGGGDKRCDQLPASAHENILPDKKATAIVREPRHGHLAQKGAW
jgi:hypothetical protein